MQPRLAAALARSIARQIASCGLDLRGLCVATECANGAYASTAAAAVAAGAEAVYAFGRENRYATVAEAEADVRALIVALGADGGRLHVVVDRADIPWATVDLVTNSGNLRPIDGDLIGALPDNAAIALMFEAWELRDGDIDVGAAGARGVSIFGVDEHHPACASFELVGALAISEAMRQRWSVAHGRVAVFSDNAFRDPVLRALRAAGAEAEALPLTGPALAADPPFDLAVLATTPPRVAAAHGLTPLDPHDLALRIAATGCHGCVQLWGDVERASAKEVSFAPSTPPPPGHQGVPMNAAGHEATVRLQVGGLAAAAHGRRLARGEAVSPALAGLVQRVGGPAPAGEQRT